MPTVVADSLRRIPFAEADADTVGAFCAAHGGNQEARMLLGLTSDPAGVFVIGDDAGIRLVATVVDRIRNGAEAAILETMGVREPLPAAAFTSLVIEPAIAFARAGAHRALHVVLQASQVPAHGAEQALRDAGFGHAYDYFEMRRPAAAPAWPAPGPLPPGWSWAALDGARVDAAHAALREMFRDALGTSVMPIADFRRAVESRVAAYRLLLDGDRIAGLVRTAVDGDRGHVRILGRAHAYRGRGLGPRLLAEALRLLQGQEDEQEQAGGARDVELSVEVTNERALDLYRRFGFEVVTRTPVFALALA